MKLYAEGGLVYFSIVRWSSLGVCRSFGMLVAGCFCRSCEKHAIILSVRCTKVSLCVSRVEFCPLMFSPKMLSFGGAFQENTVSSCFYGLLMRHASFWVWLSFEVVFDCLASRFVCLCFIKTCRLSRSRQELSNEYFTVQVGVDKAESEFSKKED